MYSYISSLFYDYCIHISISICVWHRGHWLQLKSAESKTSHFAFSLCKSAFISHFEKDFEKRDKQGNPKNCLWIIYISFCCFCTYQSWFVSNCGLSRLLFWSYELPEISEPSLHLCENKRALCIPRNCR